jgi:hypothetical protein
VQPMRRRDIPYVTRDILPDDLCQPPCWLVGLHELVLRVVKVVSHTRTAAWTLSLCRGRVGRAGCPSLSDSLAPCTLLHPSPTAEPWHWQLSPTQPADLSDPCCQPPLRLCCKNGSVRQAKCTPPQASCGTLACWDASRSEVGLREGIRKTWWLRNKVWMVIRNPRLLTLTE